eukprot:631006_1
MADHHNLSLIENGWFYEKNDTWPGICNGYSVKTILVCIRSKFQDILIFESHNGNRVLVLDGVVQFDTNYEHIYHEMMVHVPLFAHPNPQNVLVIGGGDGGCIRELLKHQCVKQIIWVEIDKDVVDLTKKYCPSVHTKDIYKDRRVTLLIDDGINYVKECMDNTFDIIIVDGSDPIGTSPSAVLFTNEFYVNCHRILKDGGIINNQSDCMFDDEEYSYLMDSLRRSRSVHKGGDVRYCSMYTPMYTSGQLGCVLSRKYCAIMQDKYKSIAVDRVYRNVPHKIQQTLKYYSPKMHTAAFVLPHKITSLLKTLSCS